MIPQKYIEKIFFQSIIFIYKIISIPYILLARLLIISNKNFHLDYLSIIEKIDETKFDLNLTYLNRLIMAEDHRYKIHKGIDFISILRATKSTLIEKKFQGASTIEQQLVRVVTFRYERTIQRKIREQLLSVLISKNRTKLSIANTYLSIGYLGYGLKGYRSAIIKNHKPYHIEIESFIVSHLKYPLPKNKSEFWDKKIIDRVIYINERTKKHQIYLFKNIGSNQLQLN